MIYLSGHLAPVAVALGRSDLGWMLNPRDGHCPPQGAHWAFENDCFARTADGWAKRLAKLLPWRDRCLFTPVPDVVGDARATWQRWATYAPHAASLGYPLAYVSQDGETRWPDGASWLFVGGTTAWKLSEASYRLARLAKLAGLRLHMGRVNSWRRFRAAWVSGFDSVDGTLLLHGIKRGGMPRYLELLRQLCSWLDVVNGPQARMEIA